MKKIQVEKPFLLTHGDATERRFTAGVHEVEDAIADHWYVKMHLVPEEKADAVEEKVDADVEGAEQTAASTRRNAAK
jgi:hypothetical protein